MFLNVMVNNLSSKEVFIIAKVVFNLKRLIDFQFLYMEFS